MTTEAILLSNLIFFITLLLFLIHKGRSDLKRTYPKNQRHLNKRKSIINRTINQRRKTD